MPRVSLFRKKLYIYLLKELSLFFLFAVAVFTFILVVSNLGRSADYILNKGVGLTDILLLILYLSPKFFTFTFPMAFLLSSVVSLGRLSGDNEVLALKASGVNLRYLFVPVAIFGLAVFLAGFLNNTFLLSWSSKGFQDTLVSVMRKGFSIDDKEGIFNDTIKGVVIYIDKVDTKRKMLSGIVISDDRDERVRQTMTAQEGAVNVDTTTLDMSFTLKNGSLQMWERSANSFRSISFKDHNFSLNLGNLLPKQLRKRPSEMDISELKAKLQSAKPKARYDLMVEIYKKFTVPLSTIAFVLLTVPLGVRRRSEGAFSGVVYSIGIFVCYYMLSAAFENMGRTHGLPPLVVCFAPNVVFSLIGVGLLTGINREGPGRIIERIRRIRGLYFAKTG